MKTLQQIAEQSFMCQGMNISHMVEGTGILTMTHSPGNPDYLTFRLENPIGSPCLLIASSHPYPYKNIHTPKRLVATSETLFKVLEYTEIPESNTKTPDIEKIITVFYDAIEGLGLKLKPRGL